MSADKTLTLQFVPYTEIESLSSIGRIKKLLKIAKENKIVVLLGRLKKEEEAELIKTTMEEINEEFKGIELAVINPQQSKQDLWRRVRGQLADFLVRNRGGFTIIGPATLVKEIKRDPNKIQLLMADKPLSKKKK
ncbi:DUF2073 domain-containing protein [Candidatus Woesearchaeota archaeon]|nr:DUF2073 domain-containing protein [Candidatus Woesearchaeota archaeon]